MPTVSVIMNCLNCSRYLREAVDSVYAQTYTDWEIIFWDNASTDDSAEIAKNYDERLRYFSGDETVPLYKARNLALQQAKGKYIAFLDCDDIWLPSKLEKQVEIFENGRNIGLIYSNAEILEPGGSKRRKYNKMQPGGKIFRCLLAKYNINLATVMVSMEALNSLDHWFDDSLHFSGDADLFLRIAHDWNVYYIPEITAIYREHGSSGTAKTINKLLAENNYILDKLSKIYKDFFNKYSPEIKLWKNQALLSVIIAKWKYISGAAARKVITENLSSGFFLLLYMITFLPYRIISYVRKYLSI